MKYWSEVLRKPYDTEEELVVAEREYDERMEAVKRKEEEREARKKAVDDAFEAAYKLQREFLHDYGRYSYSSNNGVFDFLNSGIFYR